TMSSHLDSSWRISTDRLLSPVWLTSELPLYCQTILIGTSSLMLVGSPFSSTGTLLARTPGATFSQTPALNVSISGPCSMASSQEKTEMILFDGFVSPVLNGRTKGSACAPSRAPVPPPEMPTLPVTQASRTIGRALFAPLPCRCGPQPGVIAHGLAVAISRASW